MPRARAKSRYDDELRNLSEICDGAERIGKKLRGRDAATIQAAIRALGDLKKIKEDLKTLDDALIDIEKEHESEAAKFPDQIGKVDLPASIFALDAVFKFLFLRVVSRNLGILRDALIEIAVGASPAAMFHPEEHPRGRRSDSPLIMGAKGTVAAMMHVQQSTGMTRQEAAEWIVRHISPSLAARISRKPLTARMVEEWLDRFGGESAEYNMAREQYLLWIEHDPVSGDRFREITDSVAKRLPGRKPR
jgi:hypothetical protein